MKQFFKVWNETSLILKIVIGLIIGVLLGLFVPQLSFIGILGNLFVGALKAIAPILVFFLVSSSLSSAKKVKGGVIGTVVFLYCLSTIIAALLAVFVSQVYPVKMILTETVAEAAEAPSGLMEIMSNMFIQVVQNPIMAIGNANYLSILFWSIIFGLICKNSSQTVKDLLNDISKILSKAVSWIIATAPFGIMGIAYQNMADSGLSTFATYGQILMILVGCMLFQYFVTNPILVYACVRKNPFPLVLRCLKESAITAFFTRSSAANIPVNMEAAQKMGLDPDTYSVTLPLGSTINMDGASITITVMTLATAHTLGIQVDLGTAILLSLLASFASAGASGVAGGSLLLIPLACSLFSIPDGISMQVVAVGFMIGVIQDSIETALNSSSDLLLTAAAEFRQWRLEGKPFPSWMGGAKK